MLGINSERERVTLTIKKENKKILEILAKSENRNLSGQFDFLIEIYKKQIENELLEHFDEADKRFAEGEQLLTSEELKEKLGL